MGELRIALTISGAISLGAYEGGVLAALIVAAQALNKEGKPAPIVIDAIGGASAGSITALLTARALLAGLDPVHVMHQSWVVQPSLASLRGKSNHAPLSVEQVRDSALSLLDPEPKYAGKPKQDVPIHLVMSLASPRGLNYEFGKLKGPKLQASTYLDWKELMVQPEWTADNFTKPLEPGGGSPLDFALASGANALGFPPKLIRRKGDDELYRDAGVINLPPDWQFWYTDGGTLNNEPLGHTFDMSSKADADRPQGKDDKRVHLLIHPHPTAPPPSGDDTWAKPNVQPAWMLMLGRGFQLQTTQSLFEDLRHAEKTNSRVVWTNRLVRELAEKLERSDDGSLAQVLRENLAKMRGEKEALAARRPNAIEAAPATVQADATKTLEQLLDETIKMATGLRGKSEVAVEAISPLILDEAHEPDPTTGKIPTVEELLTGEFLHHFGGFVDERFRENDFALGYKSGQKWLSEGLVRNGLDPMVAEQALVAVGNYDFPWAPSLGKVGKKNLPAAGTAALWKLYARIARVVAHESIWHGFLRRKPDHWKP